MLDATTSTTTTATSASGLRERILDGTVRCIAERGVAKTTIDDIAREAACGRATVYRAFAGGRDAVLAAAGAREVERFLAELALAVGAAPTLEDALVTGITLTARQLHTHDALRYLAVHEPSVLRPLVSFDGLDPLLARAGALAQATLGRFLDPAGARAVGEWAARLVASYVCPPATVTVDSPWDLTNPDDTRRLVRTFGLPGIEARRAGPVSAPVPAPHVNQIQE